MYFKSVTVSDGPGKEGIGPYYTEKEMQEAKDSRNSVPRKTWLFLGYTVEELEDILDFAMRKGYGKK